MIRRALFLIAIGVICTCANAQYARISGTFQSPVTTLDLMPMDSSTGVIAASTSVGIGACSGTVAGIGKMAGNELKFSPYVKVDENDSCVIKVVFDKQKNTAKIIGENCTAHSGAACGWEGDTVKRVK